MSKTLRSAASRGFLTNVIVHVIDLNDVDAPPILGEPVFQRSLDQRRFRARRAAFAAFALSQGAGIITWTCPTCGRTGHGVPTAPGASVSTSSCADVGIIALGPRGSNLGVDLTTMVAPPEAEEIAQFWFTPGELAKRPARGWRDGADFARIWARKEALGKMHRTGIAVSGAAAAGGPLDSAQRDVTDLVSGIPPGLVAALAVTG